MNNDCYCFGPPVDDCPTHGKNRHLTPLGNAIRILGPETRAWFKSLCKKGPYWMGGEPLTTAISPTEDPQ